MMNPETQLILTGLSAQSPYDLNLSAIVVIIICDIIVGGWDGLIIKVTKNEVFWTNFGVKRVVSFNDILSHVNRGPM